MRPFLLALFSLVSLNIFCSGKTNFEASDFRATMSKGDKAAILMIHFGTTHDATRKATIEAINQKVKTAFPDFEVREAYTSRIVRRRLLTRGIEKDTPIDALLKLRGEGFTHIIVQSSTIIEGIEMESLRRDVATVAPFFKEIRIGTPLLYAASDAEKVADILVGRYPQKREMILVGHGTYTPATATYAMMDYIFKIKNHSNFHVATIEGYPSFEELLIQLKNRKAKQVTLIPFMLVAGEHANNDIAEEWKTDLEKRGYQVQNSMEGLGQIPQIQDIYIAHIHFILKNKMIDIIEKKARYAKETD